MLGFQTDWNIECLVFAWTQLGVFLGLGFIAKQSPVLAMTICHLP